MDTSQQGRERSPVPADILADVLAEKLTPAAMSPSSQAAASPARLPSSARPARRLQYLSRTVGVSRST